MTPHHEHEFEAAPGLPEPLPAGERILWQGAPDWRALALHVFHLRQLAIYFALMMGVQALYLRGEPASAMLPSLVVSGSMAAIALGVLAFTAWLSARTTLYTLTSRRVVMRIGIVLTITLNVPLRQLRGADVLPRAGGRGDLTLALASRERIGWLHLWPHARPWELRDPQPAMRCVPEVDVVGRKLLAAWQAVNAGLASQGSRSLPAAAHAAQSPAAVDPRPTSTAAA